jgi:hypothetical protein
VPADRRGGAGLRSIPLATLRQEVAHAVEAASLRGVARQVGLSAPSLGAFLEGAVPRRSTRRKLQSWYLRRVPPEGASAEVAGAVLALMLDSLREPRRARVRRRVLEVIGEAHRAAGAPPPPWISALLDEGRTDG